MQTLVFNTTNRTTKLYSGIANSGPELLYGLDNIPTVKVMDGFYEVVQEENNIKYPILRVPITNTNMVIEK